MSIKLYVYILFLLLQVLAAVAQPQHDDAARLKAQADSLYRCDQYPQALETYITTMELAEQQGDNRLYLASIGNIANIYAISGEYERSEHYVSLGYEAARQQQDKNLMGSFLINMVGIYSVMGNVDKAAEALELLRKNPVEDSMKWKFYLIYGEGIIARMRKDYARAIECNTEALHFVTKHGMGLRFEVVQYGEIGKAYLLQGTPQNALPYLRKQLHKADSLDSREIFVSSCELLANAYRQAGIEDSARFYTALYHTLRDSLLDQRGLNMAKEKLYQYENRRTGRQLTQLGEEVRWWKRLVAAALVLLLAAIAVLLWRRHRAGGRAASVTAAPDTAETTAAQETEGATEQRSRIYLSDEQVRQLAAQIDEVMHDISVISDADFSLQALANRVDSNTKYVSYAINETYGRNFKTLLNEMRIEEAARRLQDPVHYGNITIQGIYQELGYNSAAAFIQAFKKIKGMTPSQFQKQG